MDSTLEKLEKEAFSLAAADRARLAMDLINSFDNHDDADAEDLWLQEVERRYQEYREGNLPARPAEDVFRDAFARRCRGRQRGPKISGKTIGTVVKLLIIS